MKYEGLNPFPAMFLYTTKTDTRDAAPSVATRQGQPTATQRSAQRRGASSVRGVTLRSVSPLHFSRTLGLRIRAESHAP